MTGKMEEVNDPSKGEGSTYYINLEIRGTTTEAKSEIGFFGPSMRSSR